MNSMGIFILLALLLGFGGLIVLLVGGAIFLLSRRRPDYESVAALEAFDRRVVGWGAAGRLPPDPVAQVRALIAADRAKLLGWAVPGVGGQESGVGSRGAGVEGQEEDARARGAEDLPVSAIPVAVAPQAPVLDATPLPALAMSEPPRPPTPDPRPPTPVPQLPTPDSRLPTPDSRRQLLSALVALASRRTLLFLGSFLLAVSALTLVVFNWASFPPLIQFGLLACIVGGLWAGGTWMIRQPDLTTAGHNLQAVAGLLVPVVAFALTRPGLLAMAPRASWLTVSLLSLPLYLLAAWRTGRGFYSFSAAIAGVSAALAVQFGVDAAWLAAPLIPLLAGYIALSVWLRPRAAALSAGPRWVAHIALPVATLSELLLGVSGMAGTPAISSVLGLAAIFYVVAAWLDPRPVWALLAALLLPAAVCLGIDAAGLPGQLWPPALAALALAYLGMSVALEDDRLPLARPILLIAPLLVGVAIIPSLIDPEVARMALPLLVALGMAVIALVERGQMAWIGAQRYKIATAGLALAALLLPAWLRALLDLSALSAGVRGLVLLPLAAAYFAGARWWPGRARRSYDRTLQAVGALVAMAAGTATLFDERTWVAGAVLLALVWGFQATLRKGSLWAALALGSALMAGGLALLRAPALSATWWIWAGVAYTASYAIGGSLLRRGTERHWTWPALGWAIFSGMLILGKISLSIMMAGGASLAESLAILALATTLALMSWVWRKERVGYPAAALLIAGVMLAAQRGFYTGWLPAAGDLALVACALVVALGLLGQTMRARAARAYALPYEQAGLVLLTAAPLLAGGDPSHQALTWLSMAGLYGLASWRYRQPWLLSSSWVALDMGLLHASTWLLPGGPAEGASLILLAAVAIQALSALWRRRSITSLLLGAQRLPGAPSYTAAAIGGAGALLIAASGDAYLAGVALGLAAILGVVATGEISDLAPWGAPALLALGMGILHRALGLTVMPSLAWGMAEALAIYTLGWAVAGRPTPRWQIWRDPLRALPAIAGMAAGLGLVAVALAEGHNGYLALGLAGAGLLLAMVARRERQPWLYTAALASADLAALALTLWRMPALSYPQLAPMMLVAAAAQAAGAIWLRTQPPSRKISAAAPRLPTPNSRLPIYAAAGFSGGLALGLAWGERPALAVAALALALIAGAVAWFERREDVTWLGVGMALLASWLAPGALGAAQDWEASWVIIEMLGVVLIGWGLERLNGAHWRRPSSLGPLGLALLLVVGIVAEIPLGRDLPALTFAMASLGLLLATLAVRLRQIGYGYAAGAALVAAGMCQLADWGVREIQGYVLPAGIYLLALAAGLRRFQGRRKVSQVIEAGAAMLLLGATLGQAMRGGGALYELLLCGEALVVVAYGVLLRLRVPFLAGVSFFVAGVLWMVVDNVQITNQWVLFGVVGLLMIAAYVLLERYQERLLRAGRAWASELKGWG
ncbi:hypothetical protein EKD04_015480 [Chloroflexales bacterium ZM16-3]|nr:hypothetical protein [Chloroflexales bacterium ZM16-3]